MTVQKLEVLKKHGVDRISINPQTMNDKTLEIIGRRHSATQVEEAFKLARSVGFDNINMDIILGLPGEGINELRYTLDKIKDIRRRSTDTGEWKDIEVDGSINCGNIGKVIKAGANIIVSGKALFNGNLAENIANMKQQAAMEE